MKSINSRYWGNSFWEIFQVCILLSLLVAFSTGDGDPATTEIVQEVFDTTAETYSNTESEIETETSTTFAVTPKEIQKNNSSVSNPYKKNVFGLPPLPIDPAIPGVEKDDDFETFAPFPIEYIYNEYFFVSGFDKENRPIIIGKVPRISDAERRRPLNNQSLYLFGKQRRYTLSLISRAIRIRSTPEKPVTQCILITDAANFNSYTTLLANKQFGVAGEIGSHLLSGINRRRRIHVFGPDKSTWLQALQKQFPRDQLPEEYGGFKGHVPIKLYPD